MDARGLLNATPFFNVVLDAEALDSLAGAARERAFPRGTNIVRQGDPGTSLFIIVDGKADVTVHVPGGDQKVATLGPADIVGEYSLLTGAHRSATVTARGHVIAIEIDKQALAPVLAATPKLVERFSTMMEQRQGELTERHRGADLWNSVGGTRAEIAARMTAFYSG